MSKRHEVINQSNSLRKIITLLYTNIAELLN